MTATVDLASVPPAPAAADAVRDQVPGTVHLPGDHGYDAGRMPWNVAVDQRPAAVAYPRDAAEVADVVRAAAAAGLRVAPQGTGHNAGPLGDARRRRRPAAHAAMRGVDGRPGAPAAGSRAARCGWTRRAPPPTTASPRCTARSPDVGVVGYSPRRRHRLVRPRSSACRPTASPAVELVTADGELRARRRRARAGPVLGAARRRRQLRRRHRARVPACYPIRRRTPACCVWDWRAGRARAAALGDWAAEAPDDVTTSFRLLQLPPLPEIPRAAARPRSSSSSTARCSADDAEAPSDPRAAAGAAPGDRHVRPRAAPASLIRLHMDPEGPTPAVSGTALLGELPDGAIDAHPRSGRARAPPRPCSRPSCASSAARWAGRPRAPARCTSMEGRSRFLCGRGHAGAGAAAAGTPVPPSRRALRAWSTGTQYLNFAEKPVPAGTGFDPAAWRRLRAMRAAVDPRGCSSPTTPSLLRTRTGGTAMTDLLERPDLDLPGCSGRPHPHRPVLVAPRAGCLGLPAARGWPT